MITGKRKDDAIGELNVILVLECADFVNPITLIVFVLSPLVV